MLHASPAFPAVIDGDLVSVDGFDNTRKSLGLCFLGDRVARCKGQADSNKDERQVGFHGIEFHVITSIEMACFG